MNFEDGHNASSLDEVTMPSVIYQATVRHKLTGDCYSILHYTRQAAKEWLVNELSSYEVSDDYHGKIISNQDDSD